MADRTTKTTPQPCLTLTPPEATLTQCGRRKHLNHWGHHCTSTRNTRTGQGAQMDEKTNHANAQARLKPACRPWYKPNKGIRDSHHTFLSGDTATSMVEYSLEKPSRKQDKEGVIMSQRIQWEALSISPEVSNARLGADIDTLEALESQICRLLNDEEMAGDSLPAVARTISSPDDTAQIFAWDHEGRSLLIYTPGGVVVEITNDQNWGGVGVHLSPMYTMAEVVAHLELGNYDTTKVLEALAAAMSTSIVKRP